MMLIATCTLCNHNMPCAVNCPTDFRCTVCGGTFFIFNQKIRIETRIIKKTIPQKKPFNSKEFDKADMPYVWTIKEIIIDPPSIPFTIESKPKILPTAAAEKQSSPDDKPVKKRGRGRTRSKEKKK